MRKKHLYKKVIFGLLGVALAAIAWADITNTATVMFNDSLGIRHTVLSNTVIVMVTSTTVILPATPTLDLPAYVPISGAVTAGYNGIDPASYFSWQFTPVVQIPTGSPHSGSSSAMNSARATGAPAASFTTPSPRADLGMVVLGLGPYLVNVTVFDNNGKQSAPAQAYVTLVPADFGGVRIYPNPWRSDKHASLPITFDNLPVNTTIKLFTVSGHWVKTLPESSTSATWDLTAENGDKVASGLYMYLITDDQGQKKTGQLAVIK